MDRVRATMMVEGRPHVRAFRFGLPKDATPIFLSIGGTSGVSLAMSVEAAQEIVSELLAVLEHTKETTAATVA